MRFLGIGDNCDLSSLYLRLIGEGHDVKVSIDKPLCHGTLEGMVERTDDWRKDLFWIREAGTEGIILFENVANARGELQDELRRDGLWVVGGSSFGDKLENERGHAQHVLAQLGMKTARLWEFESPKDALLFLEDNPARYVLKYNGSSSVENYVGRLPNGRDVKAFLMAKLRQLDGDRASLILQEHIDGVEMGVGAYFDGTKFLLPACLDWEHKRFFPGDLGELTGEMGTVVTYERSFSFFERTLKRVESILRDHGHCGYVNLNTIVNAHGIWPLEFTCRFGYPGFAILDPLQATSWADIFHAMVTGSRPTFETREGFSVGIVLTTPPFPYARPEAKDPVGLPILFDGELSAEDHANLHYGEVGLSEGHLVTSGIYGWTMVATGTGPTIGSAQKKANHLADRVLVPDLRYRRDIGTRLIEGDLERVEAWGYFSAT
jgi:phosphoribosylamine--glycine ligase